MNSLQNIIGTLPGYIIYFAELLITASLLAMMLRSVRERHGKARIFAALLCFVFNFFVLTVMLDYSYNALIRDRIRILCITEIRIIGLPWLIYAGTEMISAAVIFFYARYFKEYRETHLTSDAIRQTVDHLPTGLTISEPDGTVLLANLSATELCRKLTGELLSDAKRFWQFIEDRSEDHLIRTADGEVWQLTKSGIIIEGSEYDQITATDMTEQYRVTDELSRKNLHLREVQERMKTVAAKELSLVTDREIMNARMTVHDRMGAVLLSGKYYLDHPEDVKEEELLRLLEFNNRFMLGEAEQPENRSDLLGEAIRAAKRIGVTVEISGKLPESGSAESIIAQAIDQCSANTVRHAGGDLVRAVITEDETQIIVSFSNNGNVPEGPVMETGGLSDLRKAVESAGGGMTVQSEPAFLLTVKLPKQ